MYSEAINLIQHNELEDLATSLEGAILDHVEWIPKINRLLLFGADGSALKDNNPLPLASCPFALWHRNQKIPALLDDPVFNKLTEIHEELHTLVDSLLGSAPDSIDMSIYDRFNRVQTQFFEMLHSLSHDCTEALGGVDTLTGLPNLRGMLQILDKEKNRVGRNDGGSSIVLLDIVDFKDVNSDYDHIGGDLVLLQLSELLTQALRNFDIVARYTGEKFIFCFPETSEETARDVLERITEMLEHRSFDITAEVSVKLKYAYAISSINNQRNAEQAIQLASLSLSG